MQTLEPSAEPTPDEPGRRGRRPWGRMLAALGGALVLAAVVGWVGLRWITPHPYSCTVMQAPTAAPSMDGLVLTDGSPVELSSFEGDLLLVYFGYTNCPDVCPTTLSQVAAARRSLGGDADRVRVLLVSVDPARDDLATLEEYVAAFDPGFLAATGEPADLERVASQYGIFFAEGEAIGEDGYAIDHTATLMGIDTDGHLRIVWPAMLDVERLAADLRELL
jgi:protein SCO1